MKFWREGFVAFKNLAEMSNCSLQVQFEKQIASLDYHLQSPVSSVFAELCANWVGNMQKPAWPCAGRSEGKRW